jgi:hypothetical protein
LLQQILFLSFFLSFFSVAAWLLDYFAREKRNSSQFADFEKLLNSNFSAIQNSKIHGFKDCILSQLGVFSELSTVINLTLQAQNLSCQFECFGQV